MFRKELQDKLSKIFGLTRTTFDAPSEAFEQDTLFIEVAESKTSAKAGKVTAKVTGSLAVFSEKDKLPYGFFAKRISKASNELSKDLFFFEVDQDAVTSPAKMQNISERRAKFVFLYSAQYDPNNGALTELTL